MGRPRTRPTDPEALLQHHRDYSMAYRAGKRAERDKHIDRWLDHGMTPDEIHFACGYSFSTIKKRVGFVAR